MRTISKCPACNSQLIIRTLLCPDCGLELKNDFEFSPFDRLSPEQTEFLLRFLRCRGNLSQLQDEMQLSYLTAKRKLSELLEALELTTNDNSEEEKLNMDLWKTDARSTKASEIIKIKLKEAGGRAVVESITGNLYEIKAEADGRSFSCSALPIKPNYTYEVFDVIVDLLLSQGGKAKKGLGRSAKLGEPNCELTTVVGAIGHQYSGHKLGDSIFDPVFVLAAVLDWAGIARNERGYLELTAEYKTKLS